jgi:enoyl-CoA hydratase/carnithine racemase
VKRLLRSSAADPVDVLDLEAAEQVALFDSDDFDEGVRAFHDRRTPIFRGA